MFFPILSCEYLLQVICRKKQGSFLAGVFVKVALHLIITGLFEAASRQYALREQCIPGLRRGAKLEVHFTTANLAIAVLDQDHLNDSIQKTLFATN